MALFVVTEKGEELSLHVPFPRFGFPQMNGDEVKFIQADGDELFAIKNQFLNLPINKAGLVAKWYGDMAKFIYYNLR